MFTELTELINNATHTQFLLLIVAGYLSFKLGEQIYKFIKEVREELKRRRKL